MKLHVRAWSRGGHWGAAGDSGQATRGDLGHGSDSGQASWATRGAHGGASCHGFRSSGIARWGDLGRVIIGVRVSGVMSPVRGPASKEQFFCWSYCFVGIPF